VETRFDAGSELTLVTLRELAARDPILRYGREL
jgi:hypothetical protein